MKKFAKIISFIYIINYFIHSIPISMECKKIKKEICLSISDFSNLSCSIHDEITNKLASISRFYQDDSTTLSDILKDLSFIYFPGINIFKYLWYAINNPKNSFQKSWVLGPSLLDPKTIYIYSTNPFLLPKKNSPYEIENFPNICRIVESSKIYYKIVIDQLIFFVDLSLSEPHPVCKLSIILCDDDAKSITFLCENYIFNLDNNSIELVKKIINKCN